MSWWPLGKKMPEINLGVELGVEVHNHVLPGVDDGARTMEEALQMLFFWAEMGYQKVIATPHQNTYMRPSYTDIIQAHERLQKQAQEQELPILLTFAAEYLLEPELRMELPQLLTFGPQKYLLVEMGFWSLPASWQAFFFELQRAGYTLVIAHPERYEFADAALLKTWYEQGLYLQINLLSLGGLYGKKIQEKAEYLLEKGWVHFVGSDLHRVEHIPLVRRALMHKLLRKRIASFLNPTLL
ncbi:MAG: hypothetical protein N3A68_08315 [Bacteroidia bacterium]|jgi:tyrosine-protein phosphatase YwqE|nr:hypothetical protein [Bacteroidia bacterium]